MANSVVRNYTIEIDVENNKSIFTLYPYPVEVLTPNGWLNIEEEFKSIMAKANDPTYQLTPEEERLYMEYRDLADHFYEHKIASRIIFDTADPSGIEVVSRDRVKHVLEAEQRAEIPFVREFAYVRGASNISGIIELPYDDYSDVYVVSDADEDSVAELTFIKTKEETGGVRPYYEKRDGKTYIYVDHFSGGGGTQADPYIVSNEADLNNVRNNLGAWYRQDRDIVMGSFQTGAGFSPIGTPSAAFTGLYDGDGYYIKSLFINADQDYTGLFGYSVGGTIRNLRLIDPNVTNKKAFTGAFLGGGYNSKLYNCNVIGGVVTGQGGTVGGLVGYIYGDTRYGGGVAYGQFCAIQYCYNLNCNVRTAGNIAGGIAGKTTTFYYSGVYMDFLYSTGLIEDITVAKDRTGLNGLIGDSTGWSVNNSYWDMEKSKMYANSGGGTGLSTADMKNPASYANWNFKVYWYMNGDEYNEGYPEHRQFVRYRNGKGTLAEPFIINSERDVEQMRWWRHGYYFKFEDDVKMVNNQTGNGFYPLGFDLVGKEQYFKAYVDGNGRCVANLFIYRTTSDYVGLFGFIYGGWIKNLDIIDANITGAGFPSPFGIVQNATITNCHTDSFNGSKITGRYVGGFVSRAVSGAVIEDCSSNVTVSSTDYAGCFVHGVGGNAIIRRCYASGKGENTGGKLAGFFGYAESSLTALIEDCFTNAELNGTEVGLFGGYVDRYNQNFIVRRCVAYGKGYASSGLNGFLHGKTSFETPTAWAENYFDRTINPTANGSFGAVGKTTAEMKHASTYQASAGWDFTNVWTLDAKYNSGYPVLAKLRPLDPPILGFRNEFGKYYTDNTGQILRYLDFGTLVASQTSLPKAVWLQNNADFPVNNMKVWVDPATVAAGMTVELSISETPFIGSNEITFSGTYSRGSSAKFFVRISSDISVKTGGTFDLRAKASPV
ncbi:filamentous hemagglutinin [Brevibacillus sp. SYP-B805]|uniref:filamentous hemagglutinin n=1 Tax=Brevibacillus sp. SYP-B805 TaxID=1578199 RepID=UPI0013EB7C67|nr:filamentous hemagglutinin [Brevibacillus sp. SYP-B805]NGQ95331.1 filamentous hemagglutinin [Brevibacillus sp. SYP-B805]